MSPNNQPDAGHEHDKDQVKWKALPPLDGGVFVSMVTEVLDKEEIPNVVKTDLESGGLGMITGTTQLGDPWRIHVPADQYDRALEIFQSLMGNQSTTGETDAPMTEV